MSDLALRLIAENQAAYARGDESAKKLDIGNCGLTELPGELFDCVWLEELNVSNKWWDWDLMVERISENKGKKNNICLIESKISRLDNLRVLQISKSNSDRSEVNGIEHLSSLKSLELLDLRNSEISDIDFCKKLTKLKILNLRSNKIKNIDVIRNLKFLHSLYLSDNLINNINVFKYVKKLKYLDLRSNSIDNLDILYTQNNLERLYIYGEGVVDFSFLSNLSNLRILYLKHAKITNTYFFKNFRIIEDLYLSDNIILDYNFLRDLRFLKLLYLRNNKIEDISFLSSLKYLETIDLSDNLIKDISHSFFSKSLRTLDLRNNRIHSIPIDFLRSVDVPIDVIDKHAYQSGKLYLHGNDLVDPPLEVLERGADFAIKYLQSTKKRPINECKVILVGRGGVGKTSLQKCLVGDQFDPEESETHGIRQISWTSGVKSIQNEPIKVNFWDFGGQHIQQALHQFFYSKNTIYLLVLERRVEEDLEDFLELIRTYGHNSPVFVVFNHRNAAPDSYDLFPHLDSRLTDKYPNIIKTFGVACCNPGDQGIKNIVEELQNFIPYQSHVREEFPIDWLDIKLELIDQVGRDYLLYNEYKTICKERQLIDESIQKSLAEMLASVGTITFFDRPFGDNLYILNPDWLATGAYQIILSPRTKEKRGRINKIDLSEIFKEKLRFEYNSQDIRILMELMAAFDLCHKSALKEEWIIPSSLEEQSKTDLTAFRKDDNRLYTFKYEASLPASVIHRFIVRSIQYAYNGDYWKKGIVLKHPDYHSFLYVVADNKDKEIRLYIKGERIRDSWEFFRKDFRELSGQFRYEELVTIPTGQSVPYKLLMEAYVAGEKQIFIGGEAGKIDVETTLGLFEKPNNKTDLLKREMATSTYRSVRMDAKQKSIFISYAHADNEENAVSDFIKRFATIVNTPKNPARIWHDKDIPLGDSWHNQIQQEVGNSVIALLLLSANFFESSYIKEHELAEFIKKNESDACRLIPVYFRRFQLNDYEGINQFQIFIPKRGEIGLPENQSEDCPYHTLAFDDRFIPARDHFVNLLAEKMHGLK